MCAWMNPNDNILRIRLTEMQYAEAFIERGNIKFSTPESWVKYAESHGDGRGDAYEGTLAFCHCLDYERFLELEQKYSPTTILNPNARELTKKVYKQRVLFKDKRSMQLPCFCLYVMKVSSFTPPEKAGKQRLRTSIPGSYFKDFVENKSEDEVSKLPQPEQPALIVIENFEVFLSRLKNKLFSLGVHEDEILVSYTSYFDFEEYGEIGWYDFQQKYPNELFVKNSRFVDQSEGRIIIKTKKSDVIEALSKPIDLGNMSDIAKIIPGYFPEGIDIELTATFTSEK